jgi:hypothetical protein
MKKIISYLYSLVLLLSASYLWYAKVQWTINYDYVRSFDMVFLLAIVALILWLLSLVLFSSASKKKRYIIILCIILMIIAELWLMDNAQFFGSDLVKLVSALWIFLSLFGSLSEKKEFVKWEYAKKVEIIEA